MEYVEGTDVFQMLQEQGRLQMKHALAIAAAMGAAFTVVVLAAGPFLYRLLGGEGENLGNALNYSTITAQRCFYRVGGGTPVEVALETVSPLTGICEAQIPGQPVNSQNR